MAGGVPFRRIKGVLSLYVLNTVLNTLKQHWQGGPGRHAPPDPPCPEE
jgi:hypothetical protein